MFMIRPRRNSPSANGNRMGPSSKHPREDCWPTASIHNAHRDQDLSARVLLVGEKAPSWNKPTLATPVSDASHGQIKIRNESMDVVIMIGSAPNTFALCGVPRDQSLFRNV